jgi:hypothetical protein
MPLNPRTEEQISAAPKLIERKNREKNLLVQAMPNKGAFERCRQLAATLPDRPVSPITAAGMLLDPRNMWRIRSQPQKV